MDESHKTCQEHVQVTFLPKSKQSKELVFDEGFWLKYVFN